MELHEAIRTIVDQFGKDIITERRFLYMLADYYSFRDNPAEKHVISAIVSDGHSAQLVRTDLNSETINKIRYDICKSCGFRENLVMEVLISFAKGLDINLDYIQSAQATSKTTVAKDVQESECSSHNTCLFYLTAIHRYDAYGHYSDIDGSFVIKKGSKLSIPPGTYLDKGKLIKSKNNRKRYNRDNIWRKQILNEHCKLQQPRYYVVESDIICATPSEAAFIVTGHDDNGLLSWKDNNGRSLKDYKRHSLI